MKTQFTLATTLTALLACMSPANAQLLGGSATGAAGGALNGGLMRGPTGGLDSSLTGRGTFDGAASVDSDVPGRLHDRVTDTGRKTLSRTESTLDKTRSQSRATVDNTRDRANATGSATMDTTNEVAKSTASAGMAAAVDAQHPASSVRADLGGQANAAKALPAPGMTSFPGEITQTQPAGESSSASAAAPVSQAPAALVSGGAEGDAGNHAVSGNGYASASANTQSGAEFSGSASVQR